MASRRCIRTWRSRLTCDAPANVFLGREIRRWRYLHNHAEMRRRTAAAFRELGVGLVQDMRAPVAAFSGGQKQSVAIARAAMWASKVIIMDEPTAALGVIQTEKVLDLIKRVRDRGIAVIFISHNLPEVPPGRRPDRGAAPGQPGGPVPPG